MKLLICYESPALNDNRINPYTPSIQIWMMRVPRLFVTHFWLWWGNYFVLCPCGNSFPVTWCTTPLLSSCSCLSG